MKINAIFAAIVGYGLGVYTSYSFFRKREQERANEEIRSAIEHITNRVHGTKGTKAEEENKNNHGERNSLDLGQKQYERVNYSVKLDMDPSETASPKEDDDEESVDDSMPHEITMDDYFAMTGVEKKSLEWYTENDILTVTDSLPDDVTPYVVVDDECSLLGDVLVKSGFKVDSFVQVIYVYNPTISAAYEVTKIFGKYEF